MNELNTFETGYKFTVIFYILKSFEHDIVYLCETGHSINVTFTSRSMKNI